MSTSAKTDGDHPRRRGLSRAALAFIGVSIWGCWAIHSACRNAYSSQHFTSRQVLWVLLGTTALALCAHLTPAWYRRHLPWLVVAAWVPLAVVLVLGIRINGMRGWFAWHGYFLQPSELAKPVFVLSLARLLERHSASPGSWRDALPMAALVALWGLPIALQPDFGSLLIYALTAVLLFWGFGGRTRHLAFAAAAVLPAIGVVLWRYPYVWRRITAFLNPDSVARSAGWHIIQFRRTLASGGLFGRAWEEGLWSRAYLPLGHSDSVFASTAEKVGFVGMLPLLFIILALVIYGHHHACRVHDRFRAAVIVGMTGMLVTQAFVHLSVNLGLMPPTGITLPLVSYGGSSLISSMVAFGIAEAMIRGEGRGPAAL
ncbi:MAG: FtsW/RodA/SpoVE family cell cycle protein [Lentisphaerae bacterium]|nr:FtsW/RodA/SpoVE family cell cycle protein [Lentisphaerota bacterium]